MEEKGKKLELWNIVGIGLGSAIGTGIFVMLGYGIAYTGRSAMLVCMVGCLFMLLAYWYQFAMPSIFVLRGGDYSMKSLLFNPMMTGVGGWFQAIQVFSIASYAIALADYVAILIKPLEQHKTVTAAVLMALFLMTTLLGSRIVTLFGNAVTILLVVALALFVGFGIFKVDPVTFFSNTNPDGPFFLNGFPGFIGGLSIMAFACMGTTMNPISMAAVTKKPKRTITVGIFVITIILAIIYGLMGYVASGVLPYDQVAGQNISVTAEAIFPKGIYMFFVVGGGIGAIASTLLAALGAQRYPLMTVAEDGWLPAVFKKTTANGYPIVIYGFIFVVSELPILAGMSLDGVVSLTMIPLMLLNIYINLKCITLPKKYPEQWEKRSIKWPVWFWNVCCAAGAGAAVVVAYNLFKDMTIANDIICVVMCAALFVLSFIRLKQGAVNPEKLEQLKQETLRQAALDDVD